MPGTTNRQFVKTAKDKLRSIHEGAAAMSTSELSEAYALWGTFFSDRLIAIAEKKARALV